MSNEMKPHRRSTHLGRLTPFLSEVTLFILCYAGVFFVSGYLFQSCAFAVLMAISLHFCFRLVTEMREREQPRLLVALLPICPGMWVAVGLLNLSNGLLLRVLHLLEAY